MRTFFDLLTRLLLAVALVLGLLALGPVLAWAAQNQVGPAIVAVVIAAQSAPRPEGMATPRLLPAPAPALAAPFSPDALLRRLLAQEVC